MGGDLNLFSQGYGFGSTFTLKLPTHARLAGKNNSQEQEDSDSNNLFAL